MRRRGQRRALLPGPEELTARRWKDFEEGTNGSWGATTGVVVETLSSASQVNRAVVRGGANKPEVNRTACA